MPRAPEIPTVRATIARPTLGEQKAAPPTVTFDRSADGQLFETHHVEIPFEVVFASIMLPKYRATRTAVTPRPLRALLHRFKLNPDGSSIELVWFILDAIVTHEPGTRRAAACQEILTIFDTLIETAIRKRVLVEVNG